MKIINRMQLIWVVVLCGFVVACRPPQESDSPPALTSVDVAKDREVDEIVSDEVASIDPTNTPTNVLTATVVLEDTVVPTEAAESTDETDEIVTADIVSSSVVITGTSDVTAETVVVTQVTRTLVPTDEPESTATTAPATVVPATDIPLPTAESVSAQEQALIPFESPTETPLPSGAWPTSSPVVPTQASAASDTSDPVTGAWPTNTPRSTNTPWPTNTPRPIRPTNTPWPTKVSPAPSSSGSDGGQEQGGGTWIINAVPGAPTSYLSNFQMITFYGSPYGRALGILGNQARTQTDIMLQQHADMFQSLDTRHAIPTYHMVTTVANVNPPRYSHHAGMDIIETWVAAAEENGFGVILDVQPGHVDSVEELNRVRHLMYKPHVHFAIDPEFIMGPGQVPGVYIGKVTADEINRLQAQLHQIAMEIGVKKVLMVHQFKDSMIVDKENIVNYSGVELLIDSDGAFSTAVKTNSYLQYASEPGFEFGGIKYFYEYDDYIPTASDIMSLNPRPAIIIYQ